MVNYYDILKVSPKATSAEIKSAYRRLARRLHPDSAHGSEETALKFAAIAEAYAVLGNARDRARYDKRLLEISTAANGNGESVLSSPNRHAQRWRQMVYEKRYNDIIDRMIEEERRESVALQRFLFPLVALLISALFFSIIRPDLFLPASGNRLEIIGMVARLAVITLSVVGIIHLFGRMREAFDRFTFDDNDIHDSVLDETVLPTRQWSRYTMSTLIILGIAASFGIGFAIGYGLELRSVSMPYLFSQFPQIDVLLYPPIFVLLVDLVHGFILSVEG